MRKMRWEKESGRNKGKLEGVRIVLDGQGLPEMLGSHETRRLGLFISLIYTTL